MANWDDLRFMLAVQRSGSLQAASVALRVDRATVIRRIDALERALGARLFERRSDGCSLTRAGLRIAASVEDVEELVTAIETRAARADDRAQGTVRVTMPEFIAEKVFCPSLPRLRERYPGIDLHVIAGNAVLNLARGEADVALRNVRPTQSTLVARRIGVVGIGLFASRAYLVARGLPKTSWRGHDVVTLDASLARMPGYELVEERARKANVVLRINEPIPLAAAARAGAGITFMPAILAHGEPELVSVPPGILGRAEVFAVIHRDARGSARVRAVVEHIAALFREHEAAIAGDREPPTAPPANRRRAT